MRESFWNKHSNMNESGKEAISLQDQNQGSSWNALVSVHKVGEQARLYSRLHGSQQEAYAGSRLLRVTAHCFSDFSRSSVPG